MKKLWLAFMVLATLGSIYPFNFQFSLLTEAAISLFFATCCTMSTRGDILGNVILFVPIGFTGVLADRFRETIWRRVLFVCLTAALLALVLQLWQFFLPGRHENLQDVWWNVVGAVVGAGVAVAVGSFFLSREKAQPELALVPATLVGTWLAYRLIPFVPSFDLQSIKNSVRPLFEEPIVVADVIHDLAAWVVVAYLLRHVQSRVRLDRWLPALIVAVFSLEVLVINNSLSWSNLVGACLAVGIWSGFGKFVWERPAFIAVMLSLALLVDGLAPFILTGDAADFNWLPFHGFLNGSMYINALSAAEKLFLYGSLVYLLWHTQLKSWVGVAVASTFVMLIELCQLLFLGHTPEITDPLLVMLAALALHALDQQAEVLPTTKVVGRGRAGESTSAVRYMERVRSMAEAEDTDISTKLQGEPWVTQKVNLRQSQFDFLNKLASEMEISVSRVARRIVTHFLESLDQNSDAEAHENIEDSATFQSLDSMPSREPETWVSQPLNLRKNQNDFLLYLSREMECSPSRVVRRIITLFIESLDEEQDSL